MKTKKEIKYPFLYSWEPSQKTGTNKASVKRQRILASEEKIAQTLVKSRIIKSLLYATLILAAQVVLYLAVR